MGGLGRCRLVAAGAVVVAAALSACAGDDLRHAEGKLTVYPEPLRFGVVAIGAEGRKDLELRNIGIAPISILGLERAEGLPEAFLVPLPPEERINGGGTAKVEIRFLPQEERRYDGKIVLLTSSETHPRVEVPLNGFGERPSIACSSRLAFGEVVLNTEKILNVTCVNGGRVSAEVRVQGLVGDDPELFSLVGEGDTLEIKAGESLEIPVKFSALRLGMARAVLDLDLQGMENPEFLVELTGEGYASHLVAAPSCLHFGAVGPGASARRTAIVANGGDESVTFEGPSISDASGVFSIASVAVNGRVEPLTVLHPGAQAEIVVVFAPNTLGRYSGSLKLRNDDPIGSHLEVCLSGIGGGADIRALPSPLDFGQIAVGMSVTRQVRISNIGTSDGGPLRLFDATVADGGFSASLEGDGELEPGAAGAWVDVTFSPGAEQSFAGTLMIASSDGDQPNLPVPLLGSAKVLPPCNWTATPGLLRFSPVQLGGDYSLVARLRNVGGGPCVFASPRMAKGSSSSFSLAPSTFTVRTLDPNETVALVVHFRADRIGAQSGEVVFDVSDPLAPFGAIRLQADVISGCLEATPSGVDFGTRRVSCPPARQPVRLTNRCPGSLTIQSAGFGSGSFQPGEFGFSGLTPPVTMASGASHVFDFWYDPVDDGHDGVSFELSSSSHPLVVPVHGSGTLSDLRTDVFHQQDRKPVDVLFVIDNSGSMTDKQLAVSEGCGQFMQYAQQQGIDFHIGVTTTGATPSSGGYSFCPGGANGGEAGRLFPVNRARPRWVDSQMSDAASIFAANVKVGICHWLEQGMEAAYLALSTPLVDRDDDPNTATPSDGNLGFYRPEARLSVVIISDEEDQSPRPTSFYTSFFRGLKGSARADEVSVSTVVGKDCGISAEDGLRYMDLASATGGMIEPICTKDWGESLGRLAEQSFGYQLSFVLSGVPEGAITVVVDGVPDSSGWTYDPFRNAVVFTEDSAPAPGATIEVTYIPSC